MKITIHSSAFQHKAKLRCEISAVLKSYISASVSQRVYIELNFRRRSGIRSGLRFFKCYFIQDLLNASFKKKNSIETMMD